MFHQDSESFTRKGTTVEVALQAEIRERARRAAAAAEGKVAAAATNPPTTPHSKSCLLWARPACSLS